jgi:YfiH family protein
MPPEAVLDAPDVAALGWLRPDWDAPAPALMTTRHGGVSQGPYAGLNVSRSVGDDDAAVAENRRRVERAIGAPIAWLNLVHGADVVRVTEPSPEPRPRADAAWTDRPGVACAVTAADCLPVLFSSADGAVVAAAHAGWRGLAAGVLEATVEALRQGAGVAPATLRAWLGPCIGPAAYEVGKDVVAAFGGSAAAPGPGFRATASGPDGCPRWRADLPLLARVRLQSVGVQQITGGTWCTASDASRFFSHRRDRVTGRMVAAIRSAR